MKKFIKKWLDILVPRIVTDVVAVNYIGDDDVEILCVLSDIHEGEKYDTTGTITALNLFGHGFFGRLKYFDTRKQ